MTFLALGLLYSYVQDAVPEWLLALPVFEGLVWSIAAAYRWAKSSPSYY